MKRRLTSQIIIAQLEKHKIELKRYGVMKIGLFGSFAKGNDRKKSDLDFLVSLKHETFDNYIELKFFLEDLFGKDVDLIIESNLKAGLEYVKEDAIYAETV
ncbi:MAG: nucleotidyltransferase domain-containing protein [Nanoarchaeota archaeon]